MGGGGAGRGAGTGNAPCRPLPGQTRAEQKRLNALRWKGRTYTTEQLALLGIDTDAAVAGRFGRAVNAVALKRTKPGILSRDSARSHE
jgi:hypothetical protein